MDSPVSVKVYYHGKVLLQTPEGVQFVCRNPCTFAVPFTISFEELNGAICQSIDSPRSKKVTSILYRHPLLIFGGFIQFQTMYITDEASMQKMFSIYHQVQSQVSVIELYVEFKQLPLVVEEPDPIKEWEGYNSESEEEFDSNYEIVDSNEGRDHVYSTRLTLSQNHSKLNSDTIAEAIKSLVKADPSLKIEEVQSRFNYMISYRKAWLAKQKSIEKVFGGWKSSYEVLYTWFEAMCQKEPSAAVEFESIIPYDGNKIAPDVRIFNRVFWTFYPCLRAFKHSKPIVQVDSTNLCGKYKGTLLVAVSQDGNQNIVPIAFAIVEGETSDAWYFFLSRLRKHVVTRDGVGLISNQHDSIKSAIARSNGAWEPPRAFHMFCIRHIASNFLRRFKVPSLQKLVVKIGSSKTMREYNMRYQKLHEQGEIYTEWLDKIPRSQYALAFDEGYRWGCMTTNLVECINSVLKGVRNLPVTALVKETFNRLNELFTRKRAEAERAAGNIQVNCLDMQNEIFEVREIPIGVEYRVNLRQCRCDCGDFQVDRIPCLHVFATCANQHLDWQVYVNEVYRLDEIRKVYRARFRPLGDPTTWPVYQGPRMIPNPTFKRVCIGHPKKPRRCRICGGNGHRCSRCPQDVGSSRGGSVASAPY
ncbi:hypothetical protein Ahy_B09g095438 isoform A [Arachis hypogaea]|uniref:SWIM-type domain-containing protein n=1 Tax=Arachis hypogaea TaxID=3818 RepID=A0A444XEG1_ARAHY|nr:hypothetical protein Ahy_B09g095438 isoform A [Arachis hypogaea]